MKYVLQLAVLLLVPICAPALPGAQPSSSKSGGDPKTVKVSFYSNRYNGRPTASKERFSNNALTAAHRELPFGTKVRLTNPANSRSIVVRVNNRGPFVTGRISA